MPADLGRIIGASAFRAAWTMVDPATGSNMSSLERQWHPVRRPARCFNGPPSTTVGPALPEAPLEVELRLQAIDTITLFVEDLSKAKAFYSNVFGIPLVFEDADSAVFQFENNISINLLDVAAAPRLIAPAAVGQRKDAARFQFTIHVDDVDSVCEELARHGVALLNGPVDRPWGVRTASFVDPSGYIWEIAHHGPSWPQPI